MLDYKSIIRLRKLGLSISAVAARLHCKRDSVQRICARCESQWGSLDGVPDELSNEEIADCIFRARKSIDLDYLQPDAEQILEKQHQGYLRNELWTEYCAQAASLGRKSYQLSRFNEIVSEYRTQHDIAFTMNHIPGLEAQVDWSGAHGHFTDVETGGRQDVHIFVMTLPYSGYFYAEGFLNEQMPAWLAGHEHAFTFFGGVPAFLIPDNCATAVDRQHYDEKGILNTRYVEFLTHYGVMPKPARIRRPQDKGHVERHVRIVEQDILREMDRLDIFSLQDFNDILQKKVISRNARAYSKRLGSRAEIFEAEEHDTLLPLPTLAYQSFEQREASVWRDFHIQFCSAFYSVPAAYVGQKVIVKANSEKVYIYDRQNRLIAEHDRAQRKWQRKTLPEHIPGKETEQYGAYSSEALCRWARQFGSFTEQWVRNELGRFEFEVQAYRPIVSVLRTLNGYGAAAAERASEAAIAAAVYNVKGYKSILSAQAKEHPDKLKTAALNDLFCAHSENEEGLYGRD